MIDSDKYSYMQSKGRANFSTLTVTLADLIIRTCIGTCVLLTYPLLFVSKEYLNNLVAIEKYFRKLLSLFLFLPHWQDTYVLKLHVFGQVCMNQNQRWRRNRDRSIIDITRITNRTKPKAQEECANGSLIFIPQIPLTIIGTVIITVKTVN